jgi:hypothetical protein
MKTRWTIVCLSLMLSFLTSCATILNGTTQKVPIASAPNGANVSVDGYYMGETPLIVEVTRKHDHVISLSKEGYRAQQVQLHHVVSGAVAGNLIAGGLIGWGVDAYSGGQYRMCPETVSVELEPIECGYSRPIYSQ